MTKVFQITDSGLLYFVVPGDHLFGLIFGDVKPNLGYILFNLRSG